MACAANAPRGVKPSGLSDDVTRHRGDRAAGLDHYKSGAAYDSLVTIVCAWSSEQRVHSGRAVDVRGHAGAGRLGRVSPRDRTRPPPTSVGGPPLPQAQPKTVVPVEPAKPENAEKPEEAAKSEDEEDFNLGRFHMTFGFDITTAYFGRGIKQERNGVNFQPYATIAVDLIEWEGGGITGDLTTWHSFTTRDTNASDSSQGLVRGWYEADLGGGLTVKQDALALRLGYNIATSPNDGADEVQEIILGLTVDDSSWMDAWALNPAMTIAFEVSEDGGDATGSGGGVYLELGITPGFNMDVGPIKDIRVNFPTLVGLSLSDYYQDSTGQDNTFGFFESGVRFLIPLPLPKAFGKWTLTSGVRFLYLGDTTSEMNTNGDDFQIIGTFGLNLSF